jgi:hypothetical protein
MLGVLFIFSPQLYAGGFIYIQPPALCWGFYLYSAPSFLPGEICVLADLRRRYVIPAGIKILNL